MKKTMDQKYMSMIASNSIPVELGKSEPVIVKSVKKRKTQRRKKLTLKRRKVR